MMERSIIDRCNVSSSSSYWHGKYDGVVDAPIKEYHMWVSISEMHLFTHSSSFSPIMEWCEGSTEEEKRHEMLCIYHEGWWVVDVWPNNFFSSFSAFPILSFYSESNFEE